MIISTMLQFAHYEKTYLNWKRNKKMWNKSLLLTTERHFSHLEEVFAYESKLGINMKRKAPQQSSFWHKQIKTLYKASILEIREIGCCNTIEKKFYCRAIDQVQQTSKRIHDNGSQ